MHTYPMAHELVAERRRRYEHQARVRREAARSGRPGRSGCGFD